MINQWFIAAALLLTPWPAYAQTAGSDTVDVAAPTGEKDIDRASIFAALDQVEPGGTIRFAPGTYLIGEIIHVTVPGISVVGHPDGTTLRGCHPDMFPQQGGMEEMFVAVVSCNGLDMAGGHQTVRGLTFEYAWHALVLGGMECMEGRGCVPVLQPVESRPGGYRVENNTFRSTANGVRTLGQWSDPAVIRGNRFINTFHAVVVHGSIVHVVENEISVPEPERVPTGHPGVAMNVSATDLNLEAVLLCAGNVIAGNRISGHPDGIAIGLLRAGVSCRDNVIRGNTIAVERVKIPASWWGLTPTESDSSAVGVPIALINAPKADPEVFDSAAIDEQEGMLAGNLIEGNTISGAEGIGIELLHASGNRIVNNTITRVARRDPFPGITVNSFDPQKSGWREANGSGIWLSAGSDGNVVAGNAFEDVAAYEVFIEGDSNRVELRSVSDSVRELGSGNEVTRPGSDGERSPEEQTSDTVRVAPPTGDAQEDRASILAALALVQPGDVIQFARGTYIVGEIIPIETAQLMILGHGDGTILRGCDPDRYERMERDVEAAGDDQWARMTARNTCGVFEMTGGHGTIRGLTFEYTWVGLALGAGHSDSLDFHLRPGRVTDGGYLVENNVFRNSANGVRPGYLSSAPTVIRGNRFMNLGHAVSGAGAGIQVLDNDISVPDPARLLSPQGPLFAIGIGPARECVVEGNRIEGHPSGIVLFGAPGRATRGNVIRDNTITVRGAGLPLGLWGGQEDGDGIEIEDNLIERNRIMGGVGVGIALNRASRNRVLENTIAGIELRDPSLGEANGAGLWVSPGSDGNEIVGNTFVDIASHAIVLEGDRNHVGLSDSADVVRNLGTDNRVRVADGATAMLGAEERGETIQENRFIDAGGVRLHYLDFGGEGLPVVFVHSEAWDAHTYAEFAPRFADRNRVLAITRPGYGESEAHPDGFDVATQGRSLIDFLDALEIERAVFAGNASATAELTFLGEHHADRVAGLIYFTGLAVPWLEELDADPTRALEMYWRASPGGGDFAERVRARKTYRPEHLRADRPTIPVPALAFVARSGTMANERGIGALALVGSPLMGEVRSQMPPSPSRDYLERLASDESYRARQLAQISDPEAREYFLRLAGDPELQEKMYRYHEEVVLPALRAGQERFRRAFADDLRLVRLDVDQVVGYEYRDSPELIEPHIRRFLDEVKSAEPTRQDSVVSWLADRAIPIHTVAAGSGFADLQPLKETLRDVRVIGLGEATHGTHEFFRFKHRLFEFMVREMGVRILAFEASQSAAENVVDPYVQGGPGDVESVVASLGLVGGWEEIRDLVAWMRTYNQSVPARERVRFVGFDIQYNDEARRIVLEYLRRAAPERVARTEALFQVPVDSLVYVPYLSRDTAAARTAADVAASALSRYRDLCEFVRANETRFAARTSRAEVEHLLRHIRVLDQFADAYGSLLAGSEAFNVLRDRYMADNFRRMLDAQPPDARVAVWAHNLHLMADSSLGNPRWMGRHLRETHGPAYYALALGLGEGTFMACDIDPDAQPYWALAQFETGPPREGTVDWYLTRARGAGRCQSVLSRPPWSADHRRRRGVAERAAWDVRRHIGLQTGMGRDVRVLPDEPGHAVRWCRLLPDHDGRAAPPPGRLSRPDLPVRIGWSTTRRPFDGRSDRALKRK